MSSLAQAQWTQMRQQRAERYTGNSLIVVVYPPFTRPEPELTPVVQYQISPWLVDALEELRALRQTGMNMPSLGDFRIAEETLDRVRQLLTAEVLQRLERPQMIPFSGGGISLVWNVNNSELTFSIYPNDEEITFMRGTANDAPDEDGVVRSQENRELERVVSRFLSNDSR
jgi:hypothetical protein